MIINNIRKLFYDLLITEDFVIDKSGVKTVEILNANFLANEESIFGKVNYDYIKKEIDWYLSQSLSINDMNKPIPKIWKAVADLDGYINSNYGWCIFSEKNGNQYKHVVKKLLDNPDTRQAVMIYNRPNMHTLAGKDFMCTNTVQYFIRNNKLHAVVNMRSNDAIFGYKNDRAWQQFIHRKLLSDLNIEKMYRYSEGDIHWNVGSLHIYETHFELIKDWWNVG